MALTKAGIAPKVANDCGFMKDQAMEMVEKLLEIMKKSLIAGENVIISGCSKWNVRSKHARRGRNSKTGEEMVLDPRRVVTRSYSPCSKIAVNRGLKK